MFAIRHPETTAGLLLWRVTGGQTAVEVLAQNYYGDYIQLAKEGGMRAVCESEHFRQCIEARPSNRDRLMAIDPNDFIRVMTVWRERFLESSKLPVVGATEAQLKAIDKPVCMDRGKRRYSLAGHCTQSLSTTSSYNSLRGRIWWKRPDNDLLPEWDQKEWGGRGAAHRRDFHRIPANTLEGINYHEFANPPG